MKKILAQTQVAACPTAGSTAGRPYGHHVDHQIQEGDFGVVNTLIGGPVIRVVVGGSHGQAPKAQFSPFDGANPKLWITCC